MTKRKQSRQAPPPVHQFLVVLSETDPLVWRRIQVPNSYSLWDLHVAIQDSMGWLDYHLHLFNVVDPKSGKLESFGIPDDDFPDEVPCFPSWQAQMTEYFEGWGQQPALYLYDFGDDWRHILMYEGIRSAEPRTNYPRCVSGARRCPPEDCGGVRGYVGFLAAIGDPEHEEHAEYLEWVGGHFDPDAFDPATVEFDDPKERWRIAFQEP